MNKLCTDIGYASLHKFGETLCGDHVELVKKEDGGFLVYVLADGLGSGVKANILSILTSKIISTMISQDMSVEDCVATIANTLPVCKVRGVAYSTFTIVRIADNAVAEIIQYDNPETFLLRDGKHRPLDWSSLTICGKVIRRARIPLEENDVIVTMSDGVIHAGVGKTLNYGWLEKDVISFMETVFSPEYTAKTLATLLLEQCNALYEKEPGDDTTVGVIRIRRRSPVHLLVGPPERPQDVGKMMSLFFSKEGKHIVCGGTTSSLAADFLRKPLVPCCEYFDPEIPPTAEIEGVDLVTEGVITLTRVLEYAKSYLSDNSQYDAWSFRQDGASRIARLLFEDATDINFYVGRACNPAHQNPGLPITFNVKMRLVEELADALKQMGKQIKISYF